MDDDPVPVPKMKASRTDDQVNQVEEIDMCHNDESMYPDDFEDDALFHDSEDEYIGGQGEGDGPPNVSFEKLQGLEERAALDEVEKLYKMDVIQPVVLSDDDAAVQNVVDTTLAYDWRFRDQQWVRRCRIFAREFKTGATGENNFSPTSSFASARMLLTFALIYNLAVSALDVKDAFLMVPQVELAYVKIPMWIRRWTGNPHTHWLLKRCLPGQRNAALRWHQHIGGLCEEADLEAFPGAPTILRHKDINKKIFVNIHVDDILLVSNPGDVEWFQQTVGATLTMKLDCPYLPGSGKQLMYLKNRMTMQSDGILIQPNSTYIPKLVALMKGSGRRKKGLPYHATLENFNADLLVESELLDAEQAATFRSGLGLALYLAMDRPDVQCAVKTLSSYMSRLTIKAMSALKHLASYLDGTADDGLLLQNTDEGQCIFDAWRDDGIIADEVTIPSEQSTARFNIDAFSDSSWAGCKSTRKSTSSGLVFLNGALVLSIFRTQASVALSSCEAELYAANGLMVECMFLYRLCKFLCKDASEKNNTDVQQRLFTDSSSAMALVQRAGTGQLKHVQIRQFYLQNLLRAGIFTIHKINTKLNPSDLNTKRLSGERRKFLGKLIGLFMANEVNDDNEIRQARRVNQVTRQQVVRLARIATAALGVCSQLKGCSSASGAGVPVEFLSPDTTMAIIADAVDGWVTFATHGIVMMVFTMWLLEQEIGYLHMRFRAAGQRGDVMIDLESIHADLVEYLGGERARVDEPRQPGQPQHPDVVLNEEGMEGEEEDMGYGGGDDPPDEGDDANGDDIVHAALNGVPLNGQVINRPANFDYEDEDEDEEMPDERPEDRRIRYQNSSQGEVSDPDEWATLHYGHLDNDEYDRMIAFSRANRIRLERAANTLRQRHDAAAI
eukprot:s3673_g9.t1